MLIFSIPKPDYVLIRLIMLWIMLILVDKNHLLTINGIWGRGWY